MNKLELHKMLQRKAGDLMQRCGGQNVHTNLISNYTFACWFIRLESLDNQGRELTVYLLVAESPALNSLSSSSNSQSPTSSVE